jgi:hypothetical protein
MKTTITALALFILGTLTCSILVTSCGSKAKQEQTEEHDGMKNDSTQIVYACSMHPDVTGKKEDKCSKCGMDLEEVKKSDSTEHHH